MPRFVRVMFCAAVLGILTPTSYGWDLGDSISGGFKHLGWGPFSSAGACLVESFPMGPSMPVESFPMGPSMLVESFPMEPSMLVALLQNGRRTKFKGSVGRSFPNMGET